MSAPQDRWTAAERTKANLAAMHLAAELMRAPRPLTPADRATLLAYSGWGGLSHEAAKSKLPEGFPRPEKRGQIHEYYTPTVLCAEVARVVQPLLPGLVNDDGRVLALEPSAGIGRFVDAFSGPQFSAVDWHAVEYSAVSAALFRATFPTVELFEGPFEKWVATNEPRVSGRLNLVIANPPYGERGPSQYEDPDRRYQQKADSTEQDAYAYFLRRAQDLLAPQGLGVWLIPSGLMTGTAGHHQQLRHAVLLRHHVAASYRLPSGLFAGATGTRDAGKISKSPWVINVDLVFLRSRGGTLSEVEPADRFILEGNYYDEFPQHVLGKEHAGERGHAFPQPRDSKEPKYQVIGVFERLPDLVERPMCSSCRVVPVPVAIPRAPAPRPAAPTLASDAQHWLVRAASLGRRVRSYLAQLAAQDLEIPALAWAELNAGLNEWVKQWGPPSRRASLVSASEDNTDVRAFLNAFEIGETTLVSALRNKPVWEPRYRGRPDDVVALAEWTYKQRREVRTSDLRGLDPAPLFAAGWCEDEPGQYLPGPVYSSGDLWPRYDRAKVRADLGNAQAARQAAQLLTTIAPLPFDEIEGVSPRQGWVPLDLVAQWMAPRNNKKVPKLVHTGGVLQVEGHDFGKDTHGVTTEIENMLGWINHDPMRFRPRRPETIFAKGDFINYHVSADPDVPPMLGTIVKIKRHNAEVLKANIETDADVLIEIAFEDAPNALVPPSQVSSPKLDEIRLATGVRWDRQFRDWIAADPDRRTLIEHTYQRTFQGDKPPAVDTEPVPIARWLANGRKLHSYQTAGLRRLLEARGGLLAFDVGLGKTYTGCALVARARQEGWARRPVILVPNSIVWKWVKDFKDVLPDFSVVVIGSNKKVIASGPRAGLLTSETDSAEERSKKWSRFQGGEFDVALVTYSVFTRTRMSPEDIERYIAKTASMQRLLTLRKRNAGKRGRKKEDLSERADAVLEEGVAKWVAFQLQLPKDQRHDPGILWDELGVDLLVVDEAQNFKNLYMPEPREGGVPKFMGNPGAGSKRAWQLDFRTATVRAKTGGAGVVLLSATPAKNSPLEFYNLIQYVDHDAFARIGVRNPEEFIDRYCKVEVRPVIGPSGKVERRGAVTGFTNLHELREIVFKYGDFKTAEQVKLSIPEGKPDRVWVELNDQQEAKYVAYLKRIEAIRNNPKLGSPLGLIARLNLVAIHPALEENYGWSASPGKPPKYESGVLVDPGEPPTLDAREIDDPHSPKFDALAREILGQQGCGHLVFIDNVAAHVWIKMVLVEAGIPEARIAILNAEAAPGGDDRLRIANEFNGQPLMVNGSPVADLSQAGPDDVITEPAPPKYDVLIANAVAYEGIDLQTRTCQIHHIDLPYEPATLQQRNGRAVRQGNRVAELPIKYYLARKSLDGFRFNLIGGKLGWMNDLIAGTARATNNPGAQETGSLDDMLIELSRNPALTAELQRAQREQRLEEARRKAAKAAAATLRAAAGRFETARKAQDAVRAASLRAEGEQLLTTLNNVDPVAWPWLGWAGAARERTMLVPPSGGSPIYEGLRVAFPDPEDPAQTKHLEFGRAGWDSIGQRRTGSVVWVVRNAEEITQLKLQPQAADAAAASWPNEDAALNTSMAERVRMLFAGPDAWTSLGWQHAPAAFVEQMWARYGTRILARMEEFSMSASPFRVPGLYPDGVVALGLLPRAGQRPIPFPPTEAGYQAFMTAAVAGDKLPGSPPRSEISDVALWWWGKRTPSNLFTEAEAAAALEAYRAHAAAYEAGPHEDKARARQLVVAAVDLFEYRDLDGPGLRLLARALPHVGDEGEMTQGWPAARVKRLVSLRDRAKAHTAPPPKPAREDVRPQTPSGGAVSSRRGQVPAITASVGEPAPSRAPVMSSRRGGASARGGAPSSRSVSSGRGSATTAANVTTPQSVKPSATAALPRGFHRDGADLYADTSVLQAQTLHGFEVRHLGLGEFVLATPKGEIDFDRMRGRDFPGQSGRSHLIYGPPAAIALLLERMAAPASVKAAPSSASGPNPEIDLSTMLRSFNEHFASGFSDPERVFRRIVEEVLPKVAANAAYQNAKRNTPDTARLEYDRALGQVMLTFLKEEPELYKKFVQDPSFKRFLAGDGMSPASARPTSTRPKRSASVGPSPASTSARSRSAPASAPRPSVRAAPSVGSLRLVRFLLPNMRVARPKLSREALVLLQEQGVYATAPDREGLYATKPTWGTATEEMRRMLRDVPGVRERDVTAEYVFGRTRAARDYDYPWTLSLDESDPARRLVALPPGSLAHQVGRYESGNHRFERVLTSRADVIADMVERTDRGEITSDLADAALQAHDRVLDQLGKPMSDDPRAVAAYQAALGAGGKDSSQRPASAPRRAATDDDEDELLAALELDPELEGAIELDGDDELMAAIELDPELEDALELDAAV